MWKRRKRERAHLHVRLRGTIPGDGAIGDVVIDVVYICGKALILRAPARVEKPQQCNRRLTASCGIRREHWEHVVRDTVRAGWTVLGVRTRILLLFREKGLATQVVLGVMVPVRAGPTVSSFNKRRHYLIDVPCGVEGERVLPGDEITVQNDKIRQLLCKDLAHEGGGIHVRGDAESAFVFTVV